MLSSTYGKELPISKYKEKIIEAVNNYAFTIVSAETGSGKSTQIPQYLCERYRSVVVTEPRIMAAKTLAKRVSEEMNVQLGKEVGYNTALDKCYSRTGKILYCTDGLQLVKSIFEEDNSKETVLIIDEAHEWNLNIEVLIAWCKYMYKKWNTKVVIMSATIETETLAEYFGEDVKVINVPGNLYDVRVEERFEDKLISTVKEKVAEGKNVLVFTPGKQEIKDVISELSDVNATILPLHGEMDWDEQKKCFWHYQNPKVIVATNVAQTSVTIPDIDVVVDSGNARITIEENGIQGLFLREISKADIKQRQGRAGRTKNGEYILCSNVWIEARREFSIPEIRRSILDRVVLQLLAINIDAEELDFYHQPDRRSILNAKKELKAIGAVDADNKVTKIGDKMVKIPTSVQYSRMIVEAEKYGVTEQVMIIAAILQNDGLLTKDGKYSDFTNERTSDLLAELDVWNKINQMEKIDFKALNIKAYSFKKVKSYIKRLRESLNGIVKITAKNDRNAILKSCLYGLASHVYYLYSEYNCIYKGEDMIERRLNKASCTLNMQNSPKFLVGIPMTIETNSGSIFYSSLQLIKFASIIDSNTVLELCKNQIREEVKCYYLEQDDAVCVMTSKYFFNNLVEQRSEIQRNHPEYEKLKEEYEKHHQESNNSYPNSLNDNNLADELMVVIDGKAFVAHKNIYNKYYVTLDDKTLYTTNEDRITLKYGTVIWFRSNHDIYTKSLSIKELRNSIEMNRIFKLKQAKRREIANIRVNTLEQALENADKLGECKLTMSNGGYGKDPIIVYVGFLLENNEITLVISDDEVKANANTTEALKFLFNQKIKKEYKDAKFRKNAGKKKKPLTDSERELKEDFYSLVREVMLSLTIDNVIDSLEFVDEYYQELMAS